MMPNLLAAVRKHLPQIVFGLAVAGQLAFGLRMLLSPMEWLVQFVPDDAFYYLSVARNHAEGFGWSFDRGASLTSGFHPLNAYLLSGIYGVIAPGPEGFVRIGIAMSLVITLAGVALLYVLHRSFSGDSLPYVAAVVVSGYGFRINAISATEWAAVVAISAGYFVVLQRSDRHPATLGWLGAAFGLGFLGEIARTDFGLIPFAFFAVAVVQALRGQHSEGLVRVAAAGFLGAVAGLVATMIHNKLLTGLFMQASVLVKAHWADVNGPDLYGLQHMLGGATQPMPLLVVLLVPALLIIRSRFDPEASEVPGRQLYLLQSSALMLCLFGVVYLRSGAVQPWYSSGILVPLIVVLASLFDWLIRGAYSRGLAIAAFLVAMLSNLVAPVDPPWPHQREMLRAGRFLAEHPLEHAVGAWNAGIVNYFEGGDVLNLDGLANNEAVPFIIRDDLLGYVRSEGIGYILDFPYMFADSSRLGRGGYTGGQLLDALSPTTIFDEAGFEVQMKLYEVLPEGSTGE